MYDANCMCSFMEITFGVNMLMSAFEGFRDFGQTLLRKHIVERQTAWVSAQESTAKEDTERLEFSNLRTSVDNSVIRCDQAQRALCRVGRVVAFFFGLASIIVLYLGLQQGLRWWAGILIVPWPLYFILSLITWLWFGFQICVEVRKFKAFKNRYASAEIPHLPDPDEIRGAFGINAANHTPEGIRRPGDGSPKPSV